MAYEGLQDVLSPALCQRGGLCPKIVFFETRAKKCDKQRVVGRLIDFILTYIMCYWPTKPTCFIKVYNFTSAYLSFLYLLLKCKFLSLASILPLHGFLEDDAFDLSYEINGCRDS